MNDFRHGDVDLIQIDITDEQLSAKEDSNILAYGEATGHSHTVEGKLGRDFTIHSLSKEIMVNDNRCNRVLEVLNPVHVTHQDHGRLRDGAGVEVLIPPGRYGILIEKEFDPFEEEVRRVQD